MKQAFAGLLLGVIATSASSAHAQTSAPSPSRSPTVEADSAMVDVGGHRLFAKWAGEGPFTLVLEAGQTGTTATWGTVFPELSRVARVFAYDRAGLGRSEVASTPRMAERTMEELAALLERTGQKPPYVIVGYSMGGLYARMFAHRHPEDVAGLLLVDPASENTVDWVYAHKPAEEIAAVEESLRDAGEGVWAEWTAAPEVFRASGAAWPLPEVPVIVITATDVPPQPNWWNQAYRDHFTNEQHALVKRLPLAQLVVAERSDHSVPTNRPDVVIHEAVRLLARLKPAQ